VQCNFAIAVGSSGSAKSEEQKSVVVLTTVAELLKSSELTCVGRYVSPELPHQVCVFVVLLLT